MARKKKSDTQQEELRKLFSEMDKSHQQAFIFGIIYNSLVVGNTMSDYMNKLIKHADDLLKEVKGEEDGVDD